MHVDLNGDEQKPPIFRIGIRSTSYLPGRRPRFIFTHGITAAPQGYRESVGERRLGGYRGQVDTQVNDGLGDLGPDSADQAIRAHQPGGGHGFQQMLRNQGIHHGNAGDVDNGVV